MYTKEELYQLLKSMEMRIGSRNSSIVSQPQNSYNFLRGYIYATYEPERFKNIIDDFKKEYQ